jgi:GNAT superfamily N-acetyltransferase
MKGRVNLRSRSNQLRLATSSDIPALRQLIVASVRGLSAGYYTEPQVESALRYVFGPDTQLIADQTYYVVEDCPGELIGAGGWSRRRTLYGGDQMKEAADPLLDPATDAARLRAFFVHPAAARGGLGRRLFHRCVTDAAEAGFRTLELVATLPGEPFYLALGFVSLERSAATLPDGEILEVVRMQRSLPEMTPTFQEQCT